MHLENKVSGMCFSYIYDLKQAGEKKTCGREHTDSVWKMLFIQNPMTTVTEKGS